MRIRAGFVSNSSSTSFLIISKGELNEASFLDLMGVAPTSPLAEMFRELFKDVMDQSSTHVDFGAAHSGIPVESWFAGEKLSDRMLERLQIAKQRGLHAYFGSLSSDNTQVQTFFCVDSFEEENDTIYFNGLECAW